MAASILGSPYLGVNAAISSDGTQIIATSECDVWCGTYYILEKTAGVWAVKQKIQEPDVTIWSDTFDGTQTDLPLTETPSGGTINVSGGKMTISVPASATPWATCPIAWRYDGWFPDIKFKASILSFPAQADIRAGISVHDELGSSENERYNAFMLEMFYDGEYKLQLSRVTDGVVSNVGATATVNNPSSDPIHISLYYLCYDGYLVCQYRYDSSTTWNLISTSEDWGGWDSGWVESCRAGLHVRNQGTNPAGSVEFGEARSDFASFIFPDELSACAAAIEGDTAVVGLESHYTFDITELDPGEASSPLASEQMGWSVAAEMHAHPVTGHPDCLIFSGAPGYNSDQGAVYITRGNHGARTQIQRLLAADGATGDKFGYSVATCDKAVYACEGVRQILIVGAPYATVSGQTAAGAVYIFVCDLDGDGYSEVTKLTATAPAANAHFGWSVAGKINTSPSGMYNDEFIVAVGEPGGNGNKGQIHLYSSIVGKVSATSWTNHGPKVYTSGASGDELGYSIYAYGYEVVAGGPGRSSNTGAWYRASWYTSGGSIVGWTATAMAEATVSTAATGDRVGEAICGKYQSVYFVGAPGRDSNKGAVFCCTTSDSIHEIAPAYRAAGDRFGCAISATDNSDRLLIGADGGGSASGYAVPMAYSYGISDSSDKPAAWVVFPRLKPDSPVSSDRFGHAVLMPYYEYNRYIVGAPGATAGSQSGAGRTHSYYNGRASRAWGDRVNTVRVLNKVGSTWELGQQIVDTDALTYDTRFGSCITLSADGDTLLIGQLGKGDGEYGGGYPLTVWKRSGGTYSMAQSLVDERHVIIPGADYDEAGVTASREICARTWPEFSRGIDMTDDASIIVAGDLHWGDEDVWYDHFDHDVVGLSTSIPNGDCTITEGSGSLSIYVDTSNNPANWDSGTRTCPIAYKNPLPHTEHSPSRAAHFQATFYKPTSTDTPNAYAGIALYGSDPTQDTLVIEYNLSTCKLHVWTVVSGGSKTELYTSPSSVGTATVPVTLDIRYDYATGNVQYGYARGTTTDYDRGGSSTLGFVPVNFGLFGRLTSASNTLTIPFIHAYVWTAWRGAVRIWKDVAGTYVEQDPIHPPAPADWTHTPSTDEGGCYGGRVALSRNGEYLAISGGYYSLLAYVPENIDIYTNDGDGSFTYDTSITTAYLDYGPDTFDITDDPGVEGRGPQLAAGGWWYATPPCYIERWERIGDDWTTFDTLTYAADDWYVPVSLGYSGVASVPTLMVSAPYVDLGSIGDEGKLFIYDALGVQQKRSLPETYEFDWQLPGAYVNTHNGIFKARFWSVSGWRYAAGDLQSWIDNYEAGWLNNDVGLSEHWDTTEWKFGPAELDLGITERYESDWFLTLDVYGP